MNKPIFCLIALFFVFSQMLFAQKRVSQVTAWVQNHEKNKPKEKLSLKTFTREGKLLEEYDYENEFYQSFSYTALGKVSKHVTRAADIEQSVIYTYMPDMIVRLTTDAVGNTDEKVTFMLDKTGKVVERLTDNLREVYHFNEYDSIYEVSGFALGGYGKKKRTFIDFDKDLKKPLLRAEYDFSEQLVYEKRFKYNSRGAITEESERDFRFNLFKLNNFTYDENGRLTVHEFSDFTKKEHQITTYTYFADGQLSQTSQVNVAGEEGKLSEFTSYEYRNGNRYKSITYKGNEKTVVLYDIYGYKTSEQIFDGERLLKTISYEYKYF